jgi:hypothetical protein
MAAALMTCIGVRTASATTFSDRAAAGLVFPKIVVDAADSNSDGIKADTLIRLVNDRKVQPGSGDRVAAAAAAHCLYVNGNRHCTNTGEVCQSSSECESDGFFGSCRQDWLATDFNVVLSPDQVLAWRASQGLVDIPLRGGRCVDAMGNPTNFTCSATVECQLLGFASCSNQFTNSGTGVPPVGESPFIGELKCIQVDPDTETPRACNNTNGSAADDCENDLLGNATIERIIDDTDDILVDPQTYNAVGLRTMTDAVISAGDGDIDLGNEFQPCAGVLVFNHFFDGAVDPVTAAASGDDSTYSSELTLVPCEQDFLDPDPPSVTAQFLVFNEFEQRFSTSRQVTCHFNSEISRIDTSQPERSIFHVAVAGSIAGNTRIRGVGGGLIGSATVNLVEVEQEMNGNGTNELPGAGYNLNQVGDQSVTDTITID